mgnify:FL=1
MVKKLTWLSMLLYCLISPAVFAGIEASATVDRRQIEQQDTLTLTIRINDAGRYETPDLSELKVNFDVLGTSQNSRHSIINGSSSSMTEWTIPLYPKRTGQLTIPAIKIDGAKTKPIVITVTKNAPAASGQLQPVFMESTISDSEAYVQQQLIYTLRIFTSIALNNGSFTEPEFDNATIKQLSKNKFQRKLNGTTFIVNEMTYAIYPQQAGELIIPEQVFTATQSLGRNSLFSRFDRGPMVRRVSEQHSVTIKPAPQLKNTSLWLPARNLTLVENWSSNPRALRVGDSITRTITIKAEGVMAALLPPITFSTLDGAKLYPDKGQINNQEQADGMVATRIDSTAIIPTRAGQLNLPPIEVSWWDTRTDRLRTANIAARTLTVLAAPADSSQQASQAFDHSTNPLQQKAGNTEIVYQSNPFWLWMSLVLSIVWLLTLAAFWRLRQKYQYLNQQQKQSETAPQTRVNKQEKATFKALTEACRSQDLHNTRQAMIDWAQSYWPDERIYSLNDICDHVGDDPIKTCLQQLDNAIYGNRKDQSWNGQGLLSAVQLFKKSQPVKKTQPSALSPLY